MLLFRLQVRVQMVVVVDRLQIDRQHKQGCSSALLHVLKGQTSSMAHEGQAMRCSIAQVCLQHTCTAPKPACNKASQPGLGECGARLSSPGRLVLS